MKLALRLAWCSLLSRRLASTLTLLSVALSVALLLGVERVRLGARESFAGTISQTDLIVGARGSPLQLLLATIFHMGNVSNNIRYDTYEKIRADPAVAWTIPISLGDSHRGYRVVATSDDFFQHYHYKRDRQPMLRQGHSAQGMFEVAIGSTVAAKLRYQLGDRVILSHGLAEVSFQLHSDKPFTVCGVLAPTGTPLDRSLFITLQGDEAMHADWTSGAPPLPGHALTAAALAAQALPIHDLTAFLLGSKSRADVLTMQRRVNDYGAEPLTAVMPAVTLADLWDGLSYAEDGLRVVSAFVVVVGLLGLLVSIYNSLNERRREMAILRAIGAGPRLIFALMILESALLTTLGATAGVVATYAALVATRPLIEAHFGLYLQVSPLSLEEWVYLAVIFVLGFALGSVPAWRAYRNTLNDGLTLRL